MRVRGLWTGIAVAVAFVAVIQARASSLDPLRLAEARDIEITRVEWSEPGTKPRRSWSISRAPSKARARADWLSRLGGIVLRDSGRVPDSVCAVACGRCPDQRRVTVSFSAAGAHYFLALHMREGLAFLYADSATGSAWSFASGAVAALLREAGGNRIMDAAWRPPGTAPEPLSVDSAAVHGDYALATTLPEVLEKVQPKYPPLARNAGIAGRVVVHALVDVDGRVARAEVVESEGHLDESGLGMVTNLGMKKSALEAVRQWRFKPATCAGRPIAVWVSQTVKFSLR